jgi:hypothetical protein
MRFSKVCQLGNNICGRHLCLVQLKFLLEIEIMDLIIICIGTALIGLESLFNRSRLLPTIIVKFSNNVEHKIPYFVACNKSTPPVY